MGFDGRKMWGWERESESSSPPPQPAARLDSRSPRPRRGVASALRKALPHAHLLQPVLVRRGAAAPPGHNPEGDDLWVAVHTHPWVGKTGCGKRMCMRPQSIVVAGRFPRRGGGEGVKITIVSWGGRACLSGGGVRRLPPEQAPPLQCPRPQGARRSEVRWASRAMPVSCRWEDRRGGGRGGAVVVGMSRGRREGGGWVLGFSATQDPGWRGGNIDGRFLAWR